MAAEPEVAALVRLLCRYWRANPLACDTPDGITRWWLPAHHAVAPADVQAALQLLEARRIVERVAGRDGRVHYRLCQDIAANSRVLDAHVEAPSGKLQ